MRKFFRGLSDQVDGIGGLGHRKQPGTVDSRHASRNLLLVPPRQLVPELLDALPAADPAAVHSRRDLRLINALMGNNRWFRRTLPRLITTGDRALELGAGTGDLAQALSQSGLRVDALDRCPPPPAWPNARSWHEANALTFDGYSAYPVFIGNLIFHHFSPDELASLGVTLNRTARLVVASEPARYRCFQFLFAVLAPLIGANHVTRHDAHVSIAAGFRGDELPRALGLDDVVWDCHVSVSIFGAYRLIARRRL